jgi:hypothetical protein
MVFFTHQEIIFSVRSGDNSIDKATMKIVIMYDSSEQTARSIHAMIDAASSKKSLTTVSFDAAAATPKACIGCFKCWVKTPGSCIHHGDAGEAFVAGVWNADYLILITRILWGGYSAPIKSYVDRMLPLWHPYYKKVNGEMHHRLRYGRFPIILAAGFGASSPDEEKTFIRYTNAHRDQVGQNIADGTFIWQSSTSASDNLAACSLWFEKEIEQ